MGERSGPDPSPAGPQREAVPGALDEAYASRYRDLYERHWWWRAREELVVREVERLLTRSPARERARVLDVGCGDGFIFPRLEPLADVEGLEPDPRLSGDGGEHGGRLIHRTSLEAFEPSEQYSVVLMLDVLEHLPDPVTALRRCGELLRPDGRLLLTVPAFNALWTTHDDLNHHFIRYRRATLASVAGRAGFEVRRARYFFHWVFFAKLAVRAAESLHRPVPTPPSVPPAPVNRLLYGASRLEERLARPLRLPFGSSLLAVCAEVG